jgi:hypothetical protein
MVRDRPVTSAQLPSTNISTFTITRKWWGNSHNYQHIYDHKKMVRDRPQTSAHLWSQENGEGPSTNISTVMITTKWWENIHEYQHSYYHKRMVRELPQISTQLWSQENGEGPSSDIVQLQSLSLRHATRSRKDTDGHNIPQAKQNVQHHSYCIKHHFTEWIAMLFVTSTEG